MILTVMESSRRLNGMKNYITCDLYKSCRFKCLIQDRYIYTHSFISSTINWTSLSATELVNGLLLFILVTGGTYITNFRLFCLRNLFTDVGLTITHLWKSLIPRLSSTCTPSRWVECDSTNRLSVWMWVILLIPLQCFWLGLGLASCHKYYSMLNAISTPNSWDCSLSHDNSDVNCKTYPSARV